jgi:hypothetical protein
MQRAIQEPTIEYVTDDDDADWLDDALGVMATADWLTPSLALARGGATLAVPRAEAWDALRTLDQAGIASWGRMLSGGYMLLDVRREDARRACALLGLEYRKPPSAWSGRVLLLVALGCAAMFAWFLMSILSVGGGLR